MLVTKQRKKLKDNFQPCQVVHMSAIFSAVTDLAVCSVGSSADCLTSDIRLCLNTPSPRLGVDVNNVLGLTKHDDGGVLCQDTSLFPQMASIQELDIHQTDRCRRRCRRTYRMFMGVTHGVSVLIVQNLLRGGEQAASRPVPNVMVRSGNQRCMCEMACRFCLLDTRIEERESGANKGPCWPHPGIAPCGSDAPRDTRKAACVPRSYGGGGTRLLT